MSRLSPGRSFSITVIATTDAKMEHGVEFRDFSPYVPSINNAGLVAFQALSSEQRSGVYIGDGTSIVTVVNGKGDVVREVISHPDIDDAGATSFYARLTGGGTGVVVVRAADGGRVQTIADTRDLYRDIGPLGPTMNDAGLVAYRATRPSGAETICVGDERGTVEVAEANSTFERFEGLPVVADDGAVIFRAVHTDGRQGIHRHVRGGGLATVVDTRDRFADLARFPTVGAGGVVVFNATCRSGVSGVYAVDIGDPSGATPRTIVDSRSGFASFRGALIDNAGAIVFYATPRSGLHAGRLGIYGGPGLEADRILGIGDQLPSTLTKTTARTPIASFALNPVSINHTGQLAIRLALADGRQMIVRADPRRTHG